MTQEAGVQRVQERTRKEALENSVLHEFGFLEIRKNGKAAGRECKNEEKKWVFWFGFGFFFKIKGRNHTFV